MTNGRDAESDVRKTRESEIFRDRSGNYSSSIGQRPWPGGHPRPAKTILSPRVRRRSAGTPSQTSASISGGMVDKGRYRSDCARSRPLVGKSSTTEGHGRF
jgi:hypothetical protein